MSRHIHSQPSTLDVTGGDFTLAGLRQLLWLCDKEGFSDDAVVSAKMVDAGLRITVAEQPAQD
jgi:hypothetical protein